MIVAAAIKTSDGRIWSGPPHGDHGQTLQIIARSCGYIINGDDSDPSSLARWRALILGREDGFMTEAGAFLTSREAWIHARAAKQRFLDYPDGAVPEEGSLTSEDLWRHR